MIKVKTLTGMYMLLGIYERAGTLPELRVLMSSVCL